MCDHHRRILKLLESAESLKPTGAGGDLETGWYRGTIHGLKLALKEVNE